MALRILPSFLLSLYLLRVNAQTPSASPVPLIDMIYNYTEVPYQVCFADAEGENQCGPRGPQIGYNKCNSTTENQQSLCQTMIVNDITDFCLWSSSETDDTIGESEAREIAWCTRPGHGTRVIPPGALKGVQWLYTRNYIQIAGYIDQTQVGLNEDDQGGELDPRGADEEGNPIGGLVFSNGDLEAQNAAYFSSELAKGLPVPSPTQYSQINIWNQFIGGGIFCFKACPGGDTGDFCINTLDEVGCEINAPANYPEINGTFTVCDSDGMEYRPGVFTTDGTTSTWVQPFTGTFEIPYTPTIPASSNCQTYSSQQLYSPGISYFASLSGSSFSGFSTSAATSSGSSSGSMSGSSMTSSASVGTSSGSLGSFDGAKALPFITAGFATILITVVALLA